MVPIGIAFQLSIVLKHPSAHISSSFFPFLSHFSIHLFSKGELVQIFRKEPSPPVLFSRLVLYFWYFRKVFLKPCLSPFSICIPSSPVYGMGLQNSMPLFLIFLCAKCDPPQCWGSRRGKFSLTSQPRTRRKHCNSKMVIKDQMCSLNGLPRVRRLAFSQDRKSQNLESRRG